MIFFFFPFALFKLCVITKPCLEIIIHTIVIRNIYKKKKKTQLKINHYTANRMYIAVAFHLKQFFFFWHFLYIVSSLIVVYEGEQKKKGKKIISIQEGKYNNWKKNEREYDFQWISFYCVLCTTVFILL